MPKYCLWMCLAWFLVGIGLNVLRDSLPKRYAQFVPIPMAVAVVRLMSPPLDVAFPFPLESVFWFVSIFL